MEKNGFQPTEPVDLTNVRLPTVKDTIDQGKTNDGREVSKKLTDAEHLRLQMATKMTAGLLASSNEAYGTRGNDDRMLNIIGIAFEYTDALLKQAWADHLRDI